MFNCHTNRGIMRINEDTYFIYDKTQTSSNGKMLISCNSQENDETKVWINKCTLKQLQWSSFLSWLWYLNSEADLIQTFKICKPHWMKSLWSLWRHLFGHIMADISPLNDWSFRGIFHWFVPTDKVMLRPIWLGERVKNHTWRCVVVVQVLMC